VIILVKGRLAKREKNNENYVEHESNSHPDRFGFEIHRDFDFLGSLCDQFGSLYVPL
jgi:hypothetical protein